MNKITTDEGLTYHYKKREIKNEGLSLIRCYGTGSNTNILIESNCINALHVLHDKYKSSIDSIYIDPPYNTNMVSIKYNDSYPTDEWLSMLTESLVISKELLSPSGTIFISIDEHEIARLLMIVQSVFGKNNVDVLIWEKVNNFFDENRVSIKNNPVEIHHEYIILAYKSKNTTKLNPIRKMFINGEKVEFKFCPMTSILTNMGTTSSARDELLKIFGNRNIFSTPKPTYLIKELFRATTNTESIVLDFFAGSGTSASALIELNSEDNGVRKIILVNNNESNICDDVTYSRMCYEINIHKNERVEYYVIK